MRGGRRGVLMLLAASLLAPVASARAQKIVAPGVDSLRLAVNVQPQLSTTSADDEPGSEWLVRRARLGVGAHAGGWLHVFAEGDFGRGDARLTDGFVVLAFDPRLAVRAGQFKVPFDDLELISSRKLPVVERDPLPRGAAGFSPQGLLDDLGYSSRDIGVDVSGRFERVEMTAGLFNGQGDEVEEVDDGKQIAVRVEAEIARDWRVSGAWTGLRLSEPPVGDDAAWFDALEIALRVGAYAQPGPQLLGQILLGDVYDPALLGDDDAGFFAWQGIFGWHVATYRTPYLIGWEPVLRLGRTRIEDGRTVIGDQVVLLDGEEPTTTILGAGVNLYWKELVKTQVHADMSSFDGDDRLGDSDDVALRVQLQFAF